MATLAAPGPDLLAIRDELLRLATTDPAGFCSLLYDAALDLKGAVRRRRPCPLAAATREAGFALADAALRYARIADEVAAALAEAGAAADGREPAPAAVAA